MLKARFELLPLVSNTRTQTRMGISFLRRSSLPCDEEQSVLTLINDQTGESNSHKGNTSPFRRIVQHKRSHEDVNERYEQLNKYENDASESPNSLLPRVTPVLKPHDLVFGFNVRDDILHKHVSSVIQGLKYAMKQASPLPISELRSKQVLLRRSDDTFRKTLILDLDETLICAKWNGIHKRKPVQMEGEEPPVLKVKIRPYALDFLREMSKEFEIVIFTAAEKKYAEAMVNMLDPEQNYINFVLHREHCLKTRKGVYIKDLRIIKNRDLKDMVIVDNFTPSFCLQVDNGIPIITWEGHSKDQELKFLMNYLLEAKNYNDMRVFNRKKLRLEEWGHALTESFVDL